MEAPSGNDFELETQTLGHEVVGCGPLTYQAPEERGQLIAAKRLAPVEEKLCELGWRVIDITLERIAKGPVQNDGAPLPDRRRMEGGASQQSVHGGRPAVHRSIRLTASAPCGGLQVEGDGQDHPKDFLPLTAADAEFQIVDFTLVLRFEVEHDCLLQVKIIINDAP
jgi:hypothetical protein